MGGGGAVTVGRGPISLRPHPPTRCTLAPCLGGPSTASRPPWAVLLVLNSSDFLFPSSPPLPGHCGLALRPRAGRGKHAVVHTPKEQVQGSRSSLERSSTLTEAWASRRQAARLGTKQPHQFWSWSRRARFLCRDLDPSCDVSEPTRMLANHGHRVSLGEMPGAEDSAEDTRTAPPELAQYDL